MEEKILEILRKKSPMSVGEYVDFCLYDSEFGYYKSPKTRVGKCGDFYTAESLEPKLFSELILESSRSILAEYGNNFDAYKIVELGAENGGKIFENSTAFGVNDEIKLSGNLIVFANELLDARPFERFKFFNGKISKMFVDFRGENSDTFYEDCSPNEVDILRRYFPLEKSENFVVDFSFDALKLFEKIVAQNWHGSLIFADYFRGKNELLDFAFPTGRTYKNHISSEKIFENPTQCDITFSPLTEPFLDIMKSFGFESVSQKTQSAFFMEFAQNKIREIVEGTSVFSAEKRALAEFLAPTHMGECFRVIYGARV